MVHFMWVKLWARCNCLCLVLLTEQLLNPRKCSFSEWLFLRTENKTWKMYVVLVLSFLYPWFAYARHFLQMGALYLVFHILSLFNILLIFCDLKQSKLIPISLVDMCTCAQCFPPSPAVLLAVMLMLQALQALFQTSPAEFEMCDKIYFYSLMYLVSSNRTCSSKLVFYSPLALCI